MYVKMMNSMQWYATMVMPLSDVFKGRGADVDKWVFYLAKSGKLQLIKRYVTAGEIDDALSGNKWKKNKQTTG